MKQFIALVSMLLVSYNSYAQMGDDTRTVVGVAQFSSTEDSKYSSIVTEKVVEIITNTKRFLVVDRTSSDKIRSELELQKSEAFLDSKNLVEQDIAVAAEKMITGHINKVPIYAMRNTSGAIYGYKCGVSFQMKVVDVATGLSTESVTLEGKASNIMMSPESAVTFAMQSMQKEIEAYMRYNFPVTGKIIRILSEKGGAAQSVLLNVGQNNGVVVGDKFIVSQIEMLNGKPYPSELGVIVVTKLSGDSFSECSVPKKIGEAIKSGFAVNANVKCELIVK
ncbi:MAG: penicillin-binding protein activator LpoB [Rikenellaceae bacterium]